ncbi:unnamed protein product, partial [Choristocarpus tenellus]
LFQCKVFGFAADATYRADPSIGESEAVSVCFNDCSGHGRCLDYACSCDNGYHGDDCRF